MYINCVWWDGYHNAFTDIINFNGYFYITFRHATSHGVGGRGKIYVIRSKDLKTWDLIKEFPAFPDSRDPKLFRFKNSLGVLFFSCPADIKKYKEGFKVYIAYSMDGEVFTDPIEIKNYGLCFWKIRNFKEKLFATAYERKKKKIYMFISEDGRNFEKVSEIIEEDGVNETDLLFEKDGKCFAVIRREDYPIPKMSVSKASILAISKFPYKRWECYPLNFIVEAPNIFKFKGKKYVGGRIFLLPSSPPYKVSTFSELEVKEIFLTPIGEIRNIDSFSFVRKTGILELDVENKKLKLVKILPSGGDTSYCGSIINEGILYLSYYSQHELNLRKSKVGEFASGIYIAVFSSLTELNNLKSI